MKRNTIVVTGLLAAIIIAAGYNAQTHLSAPPSSALNQPVESSKVGARRERFQPVALTSLKSYLAPAHAWTGSEISAAAIPHRLSEDASALVAEMCDLQLLAHGTDLALDSRQWSAFAGVVLRAQAVRQTYEARIATSTVIAPGQYRLEIPVYANAGDLLRENFNAELRTELGEATATDVLAKLGGKLEARFAGFGVSAQTLDITAKPDASLSDIQITRTVTYWNSVEGSDHPATRREIHFPAYEDPTGDSWSALLAAVKA